MSELKNKIIKTELIEWKNAEWFQPVELKRTHPSIIQKLKTSLLKNGFAAPFHVWQKGKKIVILDGHHREKALKDLIEEGHNIPEKLPANFISIKNEREAKKMVLIYTSRYARMNEAVTLDWLKGFDMKSLVSEIEMPDINFELFLDKVEQELSDDIREVKLETSSKIVCPKCGHKWKETKNVSVTKNSK